MLTFAQYLLHEEKLRPNGSLGIPRIEMPQVASNDVHELLIFLQSHQVSFAPDRVSAASLLPTQNELDADKAKNIELKADEKPILVSSDSYILDGHHRWLKALWDGETLSIIRLTMKILPLLDLVKKFPKTFFKEDVCQEKSSLVGLL